MKKTILLLAALAPFAAVFAADKPEKSPEEESAENEEFSVSDVFQKTGDGSEQQTADRGNGEGKT